MQVRTQRHIRTNRQTYIHTHGKYWRFYHLNLNVLLLYWSVVTSQTFKPRTEQFSFERSKTELLLTGRVWIKSCGWDHMTDKLRFAMKNRAYPFIEASNITVMPYKRNYVSNHGQLHRLPNSWLGLTAAWTNYDKALLWWTFVRGIHW